MGNRDDDFGRGFGFGRGGYEQDRPWERPVMRGAMREPSRVRRYHPDERSYGPSPRQHEYESSHPHRSAYGEPGGWYGGMSGHVYGGERGRYPGEEHDWNPSDREPGFGPQMDSPRVLDPRGMEERWGRSAGSRDMGFGEREEERGPHYGKGPKGYKRSDERIREDVCEVISRQGYVDASDVEVTVERGVVLLAGTVTERLDKRALERMAEHVHGVDEVRNELRLRREERREPASQRMRDQGQGRQSHPRNDGARS